MKCANCTKLAMYEYVITSDFSIKYCQAHLPRFTGTKAAQGMVRPITQEEVRAKAPGIKKSKAAAEETPVVEDAPKDK